MKSTTRRSHLTPASNVGASSTRQARSPFDSTEFEQRLYWSEAAKGGKLWPVRVVCAWSDIWGFGLKLEEAGWDLGSAQTAGLVETLDLVYERAGRPLLVGTGAQASERILVLNDGIARTTDLKTTKSLNRRLMVYYLRDLLIQHFVLVPMLRTRGLGLRTVLAGGQRIQYSPERVTGESVLHHMEPPSELGQRILAQQFLYHPASFQMNTAFSRAYLIESKGSGCGILRNRFYVDRSWLETINWACGRCIRIPEAPTGNITVSWGRKKQFEMVFDKVITMDVRGMACVIYQLASFTVHAAFEGETTHFPLDPALISDGRWPDHS